jgi:hypothetical protein
MSRPGIYLNKERPDARRVVVPIPAPRAGIASRTASAREFTPAEKSLIRKVHGYMPAVDLLRTLNERLLSDLGPDSTLYTMEQLYAEIGDAAGVVPAGGHDWASLRKLLAKAKRDGVLGSITEQVIHDFAVVYSLNMKQFLSLKEIVLKAKEEEEE